jgi:hypothetical protein
MVSAATGPALYNIVRYHRTPLKLLTFASWTFTMLWVIGGALESFSIQSCMLLFMKAIGRYSVPQNNTYPLGITAIGRLPSKAKTALTC